MTSETSWSEEFEMPSLQVAADHLTSQAEQETQAELEADFESFAGSQLMIRSKSGARGLHRFQNKGRRDSGDGPRPPGEQAALPGAGRHGARQGSRCGNRHF